MQLSTKRLILIPYTKEQMYAARRDPAAAAALIGAVYKDSGFFRRLQASGIYKAKIKIMEKYPSAWLISTYWQIVLKTDMHIIGEVGFKGPPINGSIEIGYGLLKEYRNKGFMTEAVEKMCSFAFSQDQKEYEVERITANTKSKNYASQKVLKKCGFKCVDNEPPIFVWHKNRA